MTPTKTAVILAGGLSRRFGSDKCFAMIQGKTFIQTIIDTLDSAGFDVYLSGPKSKLGFLRLPIIEDEFPATGPLYAIHSLFKKTDFKRILFVAVDMPFIQKKVIKLMWSKSLGYDITIIDSHRKKAHPFPGVYSHCCLPQLEKVLSQGRKDMQSLFQGSVKVKRLQKKEILNQDPTLISLHNINYEKELTTPRNWQQ